MFDLYRKGDVYCSEYYVYVVLEEPFGFKTLQLIIPFDRIDCMLQECSVVRILDEKLLHRESCSL